MSGRRVVLFDLGGVLVRLGGVAALQDLAGMVDETEVWSRWLACEWVRRFERGGCSASDFATGVVTNWSLPISAEEFLERFRQWPAGLYEGALELIETVRHQTPVGCLSNTNGLHWAVMQEWGLASAFDHVFLSYRMGLVKPDREVFEQVALALGVAAAQVIFLDDNAVNVDQAAITGFDAWQVRGIDGARQALMDRGFRL